MSQFKQSGRNSINDSRVVMQCTYVRQQGSEEIFENIYPFTIYKCKFYIATKIYKTFIIQKILFAFMK